MLVTVNKNHSGSKRCKTCKYLQNANRYYPKPTPTLPIPLQTKNGKWNPMVPGPEIDLSCKQETPIYPEQKGPIADALANQTWQMEQIGTGFQNVPGLQNKKFQRVLNKQVPLMMLRIFSRLFKKKIIIIIKIAKGLKYIGKFQFVKTL